MTTMDTKEAWKKQKELERVKDILSVVKLFMRDTLQNLSTFYLNLV